MSKNNQKIGKHDMGGFLELYENALACLSIREPFLDWIGWLRSEDDDGMMEFIGRGPRYFLIRDIETNEWPCRLDGTLMTDWREVNVYVAGFYMMRQLTEYIVYSGGGLLAATRRCGCVVHCSEMSIKETCDEIVQSVRELQADNEHERDMALLLLGDSVSLLAELTMRRFDTVPVFYPSYPSPDGARPEALLLTKKLDGELAIYGKRFDMNCVKVDNYVKELADRSSLWQYFATDGGWFLWECKSDMPYVHLVGTMKASVEVLGPGLQVAFVGCSGYY